jgi:hypothetical protein
MQLDYRELVKSIWKKSLQGSAWGVVHGKLKWCQHTLQRWQKQKQKNIELDDRSYQAKNKEAGWSIIDGWTNECSRHKTASRWSAWNDGTWGFKMEAVVEREWLKYGDDNTKYFQASGNQRKKKLTLFSKSWMKMGGCAPLM